MESSTITAAAGKAVDAPTLTEALRRTAANHPDIVAVRWPDDSVSLTWSELVGRGDALARGPPELGGRPRGPLPVMLAHPPHVHNPDPAGGAPGAPPLSRFTPP